MIVSGWSGAENGDRKVGYSWKMTRGWKEAICMAV